MATAERTARREFLRGIDDWKVSREADDLGAPEFIRVHGDAPIQGKDTAFSMADKREAHSKRHGKKYPDSGYASPASRLARATTDIAIDAWSSSTQKERFQALANIDVVALSGIAALAGKHAGIERKRPLPAFSRGEAVEAGLDAWPRLMEIVSLAITLTAAILAAAKAVTASAGLICAFVGLSLFFFANFAAWRRGEPYRLVGPIVALIGTWGALITAIAVGINALTAG